jgi:hypothetical protein
MPEADASEISQVLRLVIVTCGGGAVLHTS